MSQNLIFSLDHALALVDDDRELLHAMMKMFVEQSSQDLAAIQAAVIAQDACALAASAHRLKGALLQFGASPALEATSTLENMGRAGALDMSTTGYAKLESELIRLLAVMRQLLLKGVLA